MTKAKTKAAKSSAKGKQNGAKRGGRPAVDSERRRSVVVSSRYTPAEYESLVVRASRAGVTPSALQAAATLKKRVQTRSPGKGQSNGSNFELVQQLKRIGNNLNQLARIANTSRRMPAGLLDALDQLNAIMLAEMSGKVAKP